MASMVSAMQTVLGMAGRLSNVLMNLFIHAASVIGITMLLINKKINFAFAIVYNKEDTSPVRQMKTNRRRPNPL